MRGAMTKMGEMDNVTSPENMAPPTKGATPPKARALGIRKRYLKTRPVCRVTFNLPKEAALGATTVCLVGEFNDWSPGATSLRRRRSGDFWVDLDLETGRAYRFRYLVDGCKFENDWEADRYAPNPYGGQDSVVDV
jgi:hypothetical protein